MINKKNLWFLTLFSLILVLSVYYVTMPSELLMTTNNDYTNTTEVLNNEETSEPTINIEESNILTALRIESEEQVSNEIEELQSILVNADASPEEKNIAYEKLKNMLLGFDSLVKDCVAETQQIYVSTLKQEGNFGEEAQKKALKMSLEKVKSKITVEMWDYIVTNYKDPDGYILSKIESALGLLKFKN